MKRGHLEDILDISWSKDSATLVSGSVDNSIIVWSVSTGIKKKNIWLMSQKDCSNYFQLVEMFLN